MMLVRPALVASSLLCTFAYAGAALAGIEGTEPPPPVPILGGDVVEPCGFPTAVSMAGSCTGTLVHPRVVVYAAHCGDEVPYIRFGDRFDEADAPGFEVTPERCETHPVGSYGFGTDAAYCLLSEPVEDIPIAPPLMGCEADEALVVGHPVTVAGFGTSDDEDNPYGIKRFLNTQITALSWDEVFIGGQDEGVCYGDSGGPTYAQASDGSWRSFGITSWGQPGCGYGGYLSTTANNILWLETASGVDITPCHDGEGNWDPGPDCVGFDMRLHAEGGDWASGCDFGEVSGYIDTCGPAFDPDAADDLAPRAWFLAPAPQSRFELPEGKDTERVPVEIAVDDEGGWGVGEIELIIERGGDEQARIPDEAAPFAFDNLAFSEGVWTLRVEAYDRAGNLAESEPVTFGIGVDPPPLPDPEPEGTGGSSDGGDDGDEPMMPEGTTGEPEPEPEDDDDDDDAPGAVEGDDGCSCRSRGGAAGGWLWLLPVLGLAARRRRAALAVVALAACGDDVPDVSAGDDPLDNGTVAVGTSGDGLPMTDTGPARDDDDDDDDEASDGSTGDEPFIGCGNGILEDDERCDDGNMIDGDGCSASCEPSGEVLEQMLWPQDDRFALAHAVAVLEDGTFLVAGRRQTATGSAALFLGVTSQLEVSWSTEVPGSDPSADVSVEQFALAPDGNVWSVGWYEYRVENEDEELEEVREPWLLVTDPSGEEDWQRSVATTHGWGRYDDVAALPDGGAIAAGSQRAEDDTFRWVVRGHAEDGDTIWEDLDGEGAAESAALSAVAEPGGSVVVAGWRRGVFDHRDLVFKRYAADGEVLDTAIFSEPLTSYFPRALDVHEDGSIMVCGSVVRASAENAMMGSFGVAQDATPVWLQHIPSAGMGSSGCTGMLLDDTMRPVVAGYTFHPDTSFDHLAGRVSTEGELLWTERMPGEPDRYLNDFAEDVALFDDGDVLVVGHSDVSEGELSVWLAHVRG